MLLTRWIPRNNGFGFGSGMDRFFDDFFFPATTRARQGQARKWNPSVDIFNDEDKIVLKAELPGVDKKNITIDLENRVLTIKGERSFEDEEKSENYYRRERAFGTFERAFTIPEDVDAEQIKAAYKDGVLEVQVPKPEKKEPRKIEIN